MGNTFLKIDEANAEVARLSDELESAGAEVLEAGERIEALETNTVQLKNELDRVNDEVVDLRNRIDELEGEAKSADEKAADIAATVGVVEPVAAEVERDEDKSHDELWGEYRAIQNPRAKNEFYRTNRDKLVVH